MMFCWILISLLIRFLKAQETHIVIYAQIGGTVTLHRDSSVKDTNVYVNWFRGSDEKPTISRNPQSVTQMGKDVKTHASLSPDYDLQISPVQDSDFEDWRCVQHVLTSTYAKTYKLYRVTIPKVPAVLFGDSLSLECNLDPSSAKSKITWISPEIPGCHQIKHYGRAISVKDVSRCHNGVWTCKVNYDGREAEATTTVFVIESHMVIYAQIGGTVTLPRDSSVTDTNVYVNWFRGSDEKPTISRNPQSGTQMGKDVKTHASLSPDYDLQISPVQDSDFEDWRCVQHVLTSTYAKTYKLYRVTIPKVPAVLFGDSLSLECNLDPSSAKSSITWIPPENSGCHQIKHYGRAISVKDVSRCHNGVWTCKVNYDGREAEATTTVFVIDLPSNQSSFNTDRPPPAVHQTRQQPTATREELLELQREVLQLQKIKLQLEIEKLKKEKENQDL